MTQPTWNVNVDQTANVYGCAKVTENAAARDYATVYGYATVSGNAVVSGYGRVAGDAHVCDEARVYGDAYVYGNALVYDNARVYGSARVPGSAAVGPDANLFLPGHVIVLDGILEDVVTVYRTSDGSARVHAGCQNFPLETPAAEVAAIAERGCWDLPDGWKAILDSLVHLTASWKTDAP